MPERRWGREGGRGREREGGGGGRERGKGVGDNMVPNV